jgi:tetratricopeptide (TPR) repeat protein
MIAVFALLLGLLAGPAPAAPLRTDIFPGECQPEISDAILRAYDLALARQYQDARRICERLERDYPDDPAGSAGLMVLFQVMMLENDDYAYDRELKAAAERNQAAINRFLEKATRNSWYYTLAGTSWGIQGIYYLRQDQYLMGFYRGYNGLRYLRVALKMNPDDWEARMGLGVFLYYSSAYTSFLPFIFPDRRAEGIREVEQAGKHRPYLSEVSRIALYYIYLNEHDYDRGLAVMRELLAERPQFVVYCQFAGRALIQKGDFQSALSYYRRIQEIDPSLYLPLFKLGECYFQLGEHGQAQAYLEKFLSQAKNPDPSYVTAAKSYLRQIQERSGIHQ